MPKFILLTAAQAAHVRGPSLSDATAALAPVERLGGVFILREGVMSDPAHETHWAYLAALPLMDNSEPDFPPEIEMVI